MTSTKQHLEKIKELVAAYKAEGHTIKIIRADRQFFTEDIMAYLGEQRIHAQFSAPHEHAQNGAAERAIQTVERRTISNLLNYTSTSLETWGHCALDTIAKLNLRPHHTMRGKTIAEAFTKVKPDWSINTFLPFGLPCFAHKSGEQLESKLSSHAFKGIIVGTDSYGKNTVQVMKTEGKKHRVYTRRSYVPFPPAELQTDHTLEVEPPLSTVSQDRINTLTVPSDAAKPPALSTKKTEDAAVPIESTGAGGTKRKRVKVRYRPSEDAVVITTRSGREIKQNKKYQALLTSITTTGITSQDPRTLREARSSADWDQWDAAIASEMNSLWERNTFETVDHLPPGHKAIHSKLVFKRALNPDNTIKKYKVRLVARGDQQHSQQFLALAQKMSAFLRPQEFERITFRSLPGSFRGRLSQSQQFTSLWLEDRETKRQWSLDIVDVKRICSQWSHSASSHSF